MAEYIDQRASPELSVAVTQTYLDACTRWYNACGVKDIEAARRWLALLEALAATHPGVVALIEGHAAAQPDTMRAPANG